MVIYVSVVKSVNQPTLRVIGSDDGINIGIDYEKPVVGYSIMFDEVSNNWEVYTDDGNGNGDHVGSYKSLESAMIGLSRPLVQYVLVD